MDLAPWRPVFFGPGGKLVCLYHPISGEGCEVTVSEVPMPSGTPVGPALSPAEVLQTHRSQNGNEGLIRGIHLIFSFKHPHIVNVKKLQRLCFIQRSSSELICTFCEIGLEIINLWLMKCKAERRFHNVCFCS